MNATKKCKERGERSTKEGRIGREMEEKEKGHKMNNEAGGGCWSSMHAEAPSKGSYWGKTGAD